MVQFSSSFVKTPFNIQTYTELFSRNRSVGLHITQNKFINVYIVLIEAKQFLNNYIQGNKNLFL